MRIILRNKVYTLKGLETLTNKDLKVRFKHFYIHVLLKVGDSIELVELLFDNGRCIGWSSLSDKMLEDDNKFVISEIFKYDGNKKYREAEGAEIHTTKFGQKLFKEMINKPKKKGKRNE